MNLATQSIWCSIENSLTTVYLCSLGSKEAFVFGYIDDRQVELYVAIVYPSNRDKNYQ